MAHGARRSWGPQLKGEGKGGSRVIGSMGEISPRNTVSPCLSRFFVPCKWENHHHPGGGVFQIFVESFTPIFLGKIPSNLALAHI